MSQSDDVINDEDIPEITKNTGGVLTLIYGGTNNDDKLRELTNKLDGKTQVVHGLEGIDVKSVPLGRDPHELTDVRISNGKYICQCMSLPLFLMYEDTANFATANQTMQTYKAGVLKRYRTWLQGILEDYWYDIILADHLGIEIKDVISSPIKVKAIFADINFETRKEVIESDKILVDMEVFNRTDVAKDIDRKDIVARIEQEEADLEKQQEIQQQQAVASVFTQRAEPNSPVTTATKPATAIKQPTTTTKTTSKPAASITEKEKETKDLEIANSRLEAIKAVQKAAEKISDNDN